MLRESLTFITRQWWHLLLFVPGALAVTIMHELAHALAAIVQGGTVTEFVWLPSAGEWGHVAYVFPEGASYSHTFIAAAPYVLWLLVAFLTGLFACRRQAFSYGAASILFGWFFVFHWETSPTPPSPTSPANAMTCGSPSAHPHC